MSLIKSYLKNIIKYPFVKWPKNINRFFNFIRAYFKLKRKNDGRLTLKTKDWYPCLQDNTNVTPVDYHYTYHPVWAAKILAKTQPKCHVDISSILSFSTMLSVFMPVKFYDYRPAKLRLNNWEGNVADLVNLPFKDNSIFSLSCMHTVEHIGLGRYGDALDIQGDIKAMNELKRVLQVNGNLFFVTPISGKARIEFNAHRIYTYEQIVQYFLPLQIVEFSLITDKGEMIENAIPQIAAQQHFGCGCFWFRKQ